MSLVELNTVQHGIRASSMPNPIPRVLHVIAPSDFGGAERVVLALTRGLWRRGAGVALMAVVDSGRRDHPLAREVEAAGVPTWCLAVPSRGYLLERRHLRRVAREAEAQVVHTHGARADVLHGQAARRLGLRTVSTLHGFTGGDVKNRAYEWLQERAVRRCDAVVAVSRSIAERMLRLGIDARRLHVVRNAWVPIDSPLDRGSARRVLGIPDGEFVVGWVGRFSPTKGADVLIDAIGALGEPVSVSIVGDGAMRGTLRERARKAGVDSRIRWHGAVSRAGRLAAAFDVFVLSSRTEGTPIALLEAIAAGVPVVAASVGGVPDVVGPAEALLVPPDEPAALAAAIRRILADRREAQQRAAAASARLAGELAEGPWLDRYQEVYAAVCCGTDRP